MTAEQCARCGWTMVADRAWRRLSVEERRALRVSGHCRRWSSTMCEKCRQRDQRARADRDMRGEHVDPAVVLEEWLWLANPWRTDAENITDLAPRLNMSHRALEKAVQRLRAKGLLDPARRDVA